MTEEENGQLAIEALHAYRLMLMGYELSPYIADRIKRIDAMLFEDETEDTENSLEETPYKPKDLQ